MATDEAFIKAILEDQGDDTPLLVYADWLDERGDIVRAEYLRLLQQVRWAPKRMKELRELIDRKLLATVTKGMGAEATETVFLVVLSNDETVRVRAHGFSGSPEYGLQFYSTKNSLVASFGRGDAIRVHPVEE
jgi:uncharacterized protein (TIGR02996 family)